MRYLEDITALAAKGKLTATAAECLEEFYNTYKEAIEKNGQSMADHMPIFYQFLDYILEQIEHPYHFEAFHRRITAPSNYQQFGRDIMRPLIIFEKSTVHHLSNLERIIEQLSLGENVILLANHQTEPDPQAIALLLEKNYSKFVDEMIFMAGSRVISDPLAVPFSKGCNMLCIFSKKHIEHPPELRAEKLFHNKSTIQRMRSLLTEGGKCIYVAPSGGRDRPNNEGVVEVAPFDPDSIEMFWLIARQVPKKTHFYPLALSTYELLPPPNSVEKALGERRYPQCCPIHLSFGSEIDMLHFPGSDSKDKLQLRRNRADHIWKQVDNEYQLISKGGEG
jgi:glycerol-3-phosphate O-acyltransferase